MDIMYVVGTKSEADNIELRCSLRSIAKNGINLGNVYVVGYDPGFLSDEVVFIPHKDTHDLKAANILDCINYAAMNSDISTEFLYSSDDHFYIKPTDFNNYPYYNKRYINKPWTTMLPTFAQIRGVSGSYYKQLALTRHFLIQHNLPTYNWANHANTHFNKYYMGQMQGLISDALNNSPCCIEPTCLMLNYQYSIMPFPYIERVDVKCFNTIDPVKLTGECFSTSNFKKTSNMYDQLVNLFPDKCRFEK